MLDGYPQDVLTRLQLWFLNEGINLIKITLVALLLLRVLRWTTSKVPQWVQDPGDLQRQQQIRTMATVLNSMGAALLIAVAGATALREFGLDVRPTLAGAGIIGITIGFGAQNLERD